MKNNVSNEILFTRAKALKLYGLLAHWDEIVAKEWVEQVITWQEEEHSQRGLKRRIEQAKLGRFKLLNEFDWDWPKKCDRAAIEEYMHIEFIKTAYASKQAHH